MTQWHTMRILEFIRAVLRLSRSRKPIVSPKEKLEILRKAAASNYPTGDIDQMLLEIEAGYRGGVHKSVRRK
jgi:hypothetical protein